MEPGKSRRLVYWAAGLTLALAVGAPSFLTACGLTGDGAGPTPQQRSLPSDSERYFNEDAQKPRFNQEINGILVWPGGPGGLSTDGVAPKLDLCAETNAESHYAAAENALGTVLDVNPAYLPEGVELSHPWMPADVMECGGTVISVLKYYYVPSKFSQGDQTGYLLWSGGEFSIWRMLSERHAFPLFGAAKRMGPISIAGRSAVLMRPVMPEGMDIGMGDGAIVIAEDFGLTVIQGSGLPLSEFIKVAEGLY